MVISQKFLGKQYPPISYQISREKLKEFLIATKADLEKFSDLTPPTFPVVYQHELLAGILFDKDLKLNLAKLVHGEQEFIFYKPTAIGDTIKSKGVIEKIFQKGVHDFVVFKSSSYNQVNELVCESIWTFVIRGGNEKDFTMKEKLATKLLSILPENPQEKKTKRKAYLNLCNLSGSKIDFNKAKQDLLYFEKINDRESKLIVLIDKYMPQVYAGASGDYNIIHLDRDFAKSAGLGTNILHGMATMALGANLASHSIFPQKIKSFKSRFAGVVKPLDVLTFSGSWDDSMKSFSFIAKNQLGQLVLSSAQLDLY
jgi:acyl dehydratase